MRDDALPRLTRALDRIPGLLYRIDGLPPEDAADDGSPDDRLRRRVRIALTQAHIAVLHPGELAEPTATTEITVDLARHGFRRRIPILAIADAAHIAGAGDGSPSMDRLVALDPGAIAGALQDLLMQSSEEVRELSRATLGALTPQGPLIAAMPGAPQRISPGARALPVDAILSAYEALKAARPTPRRRG